MRWFIYVWTAVSVCFFFSSCVNSNTKLKESAKKHSQWVVEHLYSDSIYAVLPHKYFPDKPTRELITEFRKKCVEKPTKGGFKQQLYQINLSGNNEALYIYEYLCGSEVTQIRVGYILMKDTFEVAGLGIYYHTPQQ